MHQIRPRPRWGSLPHSPDPQLDLRGLLLRGPRGRGEERKGGEKKEGKERGREGFPQRN